MEDTLTLTYKIPDENEKKYRIRVSTAGIEKPKFPDKSAKKDDCFKFSFHLFKDMGRYVANARDGHRDATINEFTLINYIRFGGNESIYNEFDFVDVFPDFNTAVFLLHQAQTLYIPIYGTSKPKDYLADIFCYYELTDFGMSHQGFFEIARELSEYLIPIIEQFFNAYNDNKKAFNNSRVILGGHSLGGAVAQMVYIILKKKCPMVNLYCLTLGAPFCLTNRYNEIEECPKQVLNIINRKDPIPLITTSYNLGGYLAIFQQYSTDKIPCSPPSFSAITKIYKGNFAYKAFAKYCLLDSTSEDVLLPLENNHGSIQLKKGEESNLLFLNNHFMDEYKSIFHLYISLLMKKGLILESKPQFIMNRSNMLLKEDSTYNLKPLIFKVYDLEILKNYTFPKKSKKHHHWNIFHHINQSKETISTESIYESNQTIDIEKQIQINTQKKSILNDNLIDISQDTLEMKKNTNISSIAIPLINEQNNN
ncbi:hypothetical protein WA158_006675 [Blastocystis sp. Blastoise]